MQRDTQREPRREPLSSSRSSSRTSIRAIRRRSKWYHEVPVLGTFVRTMKDILGFEDSLRYRERYQHIESSHRRRRRKRSSPPDDEYYFYRRPRRNSGPFQENPQPQHQYEGTRKRNRIYHSPGLKPQRGSRWGDIYRDRDRGRDHPTWKDEPLLERPSRSASTSSYTRTRHPKIIERTPNTTAEACSAQRRRVSFTDPLETPPRPLRQKRSSIDDQTGSRKRNSHETPGRFYREDTSIDTSIRIQEREPRPRSPVLERTPLRSGRRISTSPPRRGSPGSYENHGCDYGADVQYIPSRESRPYSYPDIDIEIVDRSPKRPRSSERRERWYSSMNRPPDIIDAANQELDARSRRMLDEACYRRSALRGRRNEFEVRR
jgi:hypothetical protein